MKKYAIILICFVFIQNVQAQNKKSKIETIVIKTSAQCGDCETRIEDALNYTKGVKFAELNLETKDVTVKFLSSKITLQQIKEKLASIGYDADEVKASEENVLKLPLCCQPGGMKN